MISGNPPPGVVGTPYTATLVASGGTGALKWSQASGSLPAGLAFNTTTGVISGTPTAAGSATFAAQVTDASDVPFTVKASETIVVTAAATQLSLTGNPPAGVVGTAYATTLAGAGGTAPYSFTVLSGTLPAGLSLASTTGAITGVPTTGRHHQLHRAGSGCVRPEGHGNLHHHHRERGRNNHPHHLHAAEWNRRGSRTAPPSA